MADAMAGTDALVTTVPGIVLTVMVADCVPLVLFDPVARVLACVHAGWGGTVRGVTPAALAAMRSLGSDPASVIAGIGPAIHPDRYQVGADVVEMAEATFGDRCKKVVRPDGTGKWTFDLWRGNMIQLADGASRTTRYTSRHWVPASARASSATSPRVRAGGSPRWRG